MELDNFLGAGPFKMMDGSHLCHHGSCVNPGHICYEPSDSNHDREKCREEAVFYRREGRAVPEHCRRHRVPCLLRVRSSFSVGDRPLTTFSLRRSPRTRLV